MHAAKNLFSGPTMNIFILDNDPRLAAQYHCDKHVVKMVTETAQMLCAVLILSGETAPYRLTHKNHPCTKWAMSSLSNWMWLKRLGLHLNDEYNYRYGMHKIHKAGEVIKSLPAPKIQDLGLTPFPQAMPDQYKDADPVKAYRSYYAGEKQRMLQYKNREMPAWARG
jgi:hypothetical protein